MVQIKIQLNRSSRTWVTHIGSFGGAWSNHLHALGQICADLGLQFTAFVRGGPFANPSAMLNDLAANTNNQLVYLDYADYKKRAQHEFVQQLAAHYQCHILPEGGSTELAVQGCAHILPQHAIEQFQYFVVAAGTGATAAGLLRQLAPYPDKELIVIPVLKQGEFIAQTIHSWTMHDKVRAKLTLWLDGHFGGYAKVDAQLLNLIELSDALGLPLEPIYSGKVLQRLLQSDINLQQTLMIHTGGLQGRRGFGL